jgi:hypothetical protein
MANRIEEDGRLLGDPNNVVSQIREFVKLKDSLAVLETRQKELREKLFAQIDAEGVEDDKGNVQFYLDQDIDGVVRLEKQRRVTRKLNESVAEEVIAKHGLEDDLYEMKRVIKEDALMAAFYEEKITEEELDSMFPATVVWALRTLKN